MNEKRFIQLGDTHIKDTITGEEWYAPCETSLLETLNELMTQCHELKEENEQLRKEKIEANAFIVEKGLEIDFINWSANLEGGE